MDREEFLAHYGVKGMQWGVRKNGSRSGKIIPSPKATAKKLSDDELKKAVARLQLEKQYTDLSKSQSVKAGEEVVRNLGKELGKTALTLAVTSASAKAVSIYMAARKAG
jgi:hypothetical protein